jgi:hypothetical protein
VSANGEFPLQWLSSYIEQRRKVCVNHRQVLIGNSTLHHVDCANWYLTSFLHFFPHRQLGLPHASFSIAEPSGFIWHSGATTNVPFHWPGKLVKANTSLISSCNFVGHVTLQTELIVAKSHLTDDFIVPVPFGIICPVAEIAESVT